MLGYSNWAIILVSIFYIFDSDLFTYGLGISNSST